MRINIIKQTVLLFMLTVTAAKAGLIPQDSFINNNANQMYWTNVTLGLDVMRLSYSDLLNTDGTSSGEQASYENINTFLAGQSQWRWATVTEFEDTQQWFDTDPNEAYWTTAQNEGSSLFFALNGTGPRFEHNGYDENYGYDDEGWASWDIVTDFGFNYDFGSLSKYRDATTLRHVTIGDYADTHPLAYVHPENEDINKGWHNLNDDPGRYSISYKTLQSDYSNSAALLVRNSSVTSVPEPSSLIIFLTALALVLSSKKRYL